MKLPIEKLRNLVAAGVEKRWGGTDGKLLVPQMNIDYEIATIERSGWTDYFVLATEMVDAARKAGGRIGPGRGAVWGECCGVCPRHHKHKYHRDSKSPF